MSCPTSLKRAQENSDKLCMMPTPDAQSIHYLVNLYVIMTEESFKETFGQDKTGAFLLSFPFFFFFFNAASRDLIYVGTTLAPEMLKIITLAKKKNSCSFPQLFNAVDSHKPSMVRFASLCSKLLWNWVWHKPSAKLRDLACLSLDILLQLHLPFAEEKKRKRIVAFVFSLALYMYYPHFCTSVNATECDVSYLFY